MERLDQATTELIEQEVRGHFPEGLVDSVAVLQYGDDPAVEPGQVVVQVTVASAAEAEGDQDLLGAFHRAQGEALRQLQLDIGARWPQANRFKFVTGQGDGHKFMWRAPVPDEAPGELTDPLPEQRMDDLRRPRREREVAHHHRADGEGDDADGDHQAGRDLVVEPPDDGRRDHHGSEGDCARRNRRA